MKRIPLGLVLAALVLAAFFPSLFNGFVHYDDYVYIVENPTVASSHSLKALWIAWTSPHEQNFTPLLWTTFRGLFQIFGNNPLPFHLLSILFHVGCALLVASIARQLGANPSIAAIAALLWAIHPQRVEAVSWAAALKEPASAFFALGSVRAWFAWRRGENSERSRYWGICFLSLAISLLFKQSALAIPFVLFLWDSVTREKMQPILLKPHLPFFALSIAGALAAIGANRTAIPHSEYLAFESVFDHLTHFLAALGFTLQKTFLPIGLLPDYPVPLQKSLPAIGGFLAITSYFVALFFSLRKKKNSLTFGLLWVAALWLPASGLFPTPLEFTADRLSYLPSSLLFPALFISVTQLPRQLLLLLIPLFALMSFQTLRQQRVWATDLTLFDHSLATNDRHYPSLLNRAILHAQSGDPGRAELMLKKAIELYPLRSGAYQKLFQLYLYGGYPDSARALLEVWKKELPRDKAVNDYDLELNMN